MYATSQIMPTSQSRLGANCINSVRGDDVGDDEAGGTDNTGWLDFIWMLG